MYTTPSLDPSDTNDIYKYVMELIPQTDDLQVFLQKVYFRFNMPIIVTDIAFRLIAYGGPYPCPDSFWQTIIESGAAKPETVMDIYLGENVTDKMSAAGRPIDVSWATCAEYPQTTSSIYVGNSIEGCCSVIYMEKNLLNFALELNAAVKTAVEIYLNGKMRKAPLGAPPDRLIAARLLLENTDAPIKLLTSTSFYKTVGLTPHYMVAAIRTDSISTGRLQNIVNSIKVRYPQMLYTNKSDDIYMFFQNISTIAFREQILSDIEMEAGEKATFVCGTSGIFNDLSLRSPYIEQAKLALEYGVRMKGKNSIFSYYDHFSEIVLQLGYENISAHNIILPEVQQLLDYDKDNSSNYYESLNCYLSERCDMTKAAAKLFLHRNSLMYRIKKCEEIMDVRLDDAKTFEKLYLCCTIREMKKQSFFQ